MNTSENLPLFKPEAEDLLNVKEAVKWATDYIKKNVNESNITYLVTYGKIHRYGENGTFLVSKIELKAYYDSYYGKKEINYKEKLGDDLDWHLSFDHLKEADTTKHVHRFHPYKGKFIPQLVEYFLDSHTDEFKKEVYFKEGDIVLDPFGGSGTTLVQANELNIHAIGIDVSEFNSLISNVKISQVDLFELAEVIKDITDKLTSFVAELNVFQFEEELLSLLSSFNDKFFPSPEFKLQVNKKEIDEFEYAEKKANQFLPQYEELINKYSIDTKTDKNGTFLEAWYIKNVRDEIKYVAELIDSVKNQKIKDVLRIILSRTVRSCRATTHSDLATLKESVTTTYYCTKHRKICKPLFSILKWWKSYSTDTLKRYSTFYSLNTPTFQVCLTGDSRSIDIFEELEKISSDFAGLARSQKIKGIFSSPPYVGIIDYHEQHAYAYSLFNFARQDENEIGPLFKGKGKKAQESYVEGISQVLLNCKKFMVEDFDIFLVANDNLNLYPAIAEKSGLQIVKQFKRPVLNRTERDRAVYGEIIFHMKQG